MEMQNAALMPGSVPSVSFPYLPALGTLSLEPGTEVRIDKVDARAYFYTRGVDPAWIPWFAMPPVAWRGERLFPAYRAWPMGFGVSPCVAQSITDVATENAGLPSDRRLLMGSPDPSALPIWGNILDDVWVIRDAAGDDLAANKWVDDVANE